MQDLGTSEPHLPFLVAEFSVASRHLYDDHQYKLTAAMHERIDMIINEKLLNDQASPLQMSDDDVWGEECSDDGMHQEARARQASFHNVRIMKTKSV